MHIISIVDKQSKCWFLAVLKNEETQLEEPKRESVGHWTEIPQCPLVSMGGTPVE